METAVPAANPACFVVDSPIAVFVAGIAVAGGGIEVATKRVRHLGAVHSNSTHLLVMEIDKIVGTGAVPVLGIACCGVENGAAVDKTGRLIFFFLLAGIAEAGGRIQLTTV